MHYIVSESNVSPRGLYAHNLNIYVFKTMLKAGHPLISVPSKRMVAVIKLALTTLTFSQVVARHLYERLSGRRADELAHSSNKAGLFTRQTLLLRRLNISTTQLYERVKA